MTSAPVANGLLGQVGQLWSMLDELSENDPAGYRKLLETQMKEGADLRSPPELHCALRTEALEPGRGPLYINVCSWNRVPAPQDPSRPLPVCAGELESGTDEGRGGYTVLDVALNPAVLLDGNVENREVCALALRFAQKHYGLSVCQDFTVIGCSPNSSTDEIYRRLRFRQRPIASEPVKVSQTPAHLLRQISSFNAEKEGEDAAAQMIRGPSEGKRPDLIQVIATADAQPQQPRHRLQLETDGAGAARRVELTVELPKVSSVSECQLRISKDDILLEVEGLYCLLLDLPAAVDEDTASAIFNKKKQRLTLTVDVSDSRSALQNN
eukprot:XP_003968573.1 PREDICTED: PIH1 domain-containing protein 2 [Takifugu rubripes]